MITDKFTATLGIVPGYFHDNKARTTLSGVANIWQQEALEVEKSTGIYVSAVITNALTVYKEEWGCPKDGEVTVFITGERNPIFIKDSMFYKNAVYLLMEKMAARLHQSTCQFSFTTSEFHYIKLDNEKT